MFSDKKPEDTKPAAPPEGNGSEEARTGAGAATLRASTPPTMPARPASRPGVMRPEIVRRAREYGTSPADERSMSNYGGDGKKLIVGRDIELNGKISSCEKLVVQGKVEANISECREIEIAETGTFIGEAEIEVAEISGAFEGTINARDLLIVRATGHINGTIRFGRLEVERGGQIQGDVQVLKTDE